MADYVCSRCGAQAYNDGRMGDGPVLTCGCDRRGSRWINDGRGGYNTNPSGATPVESEYIDNGGDPDDYWKYPGR